MRFVPDADWSGTVADGLTFRAWDQTSGVNGDSIDMTAAANYRDEFNTITYSANDGSSVWTSAWIEGNDDGSASSGNVRIENDMLHIDNQDGGSLEYVYRTADLSDATSATLSLYFEASAGGATDAIFVDVSLDGGATWTTLREGTISGTPSGTRSMVIEDFVPLQDNMLFRFGVKAGLDGAGEYVRFDNIDIAWTGGGSGGSSSISAATASSSITVMPVNDAPVLDLDADDSAGAAGVDFATTFVQDGGPVAVADADAILTDVDSGTLDSLSATLTNLLDVNQEVLSADTSGTSLTANWNSASGVLTISGPGTLADYQSVLRTLAYDNTAQNPDATTRVVEIIASDGVSFSTLAHTDITMRVAPVAADDAFTVAEGSTTVLDLAANDTDANGDLDLDSITIVSGPSSGSLLINANGTVTYTHDGSETAADSFTYTIQDASGLTSKAATVNITVTT